jgi:hypothetical protein
VFVLGRNAVIVVQRTTRDCAGTICAFVICALPKSETVQRLQLKLLQNIQWLRSIPRVGAVQWFDVLTMSGIISKLAGTGGGLPRFENSRNVEMNSNISAAELNWLGQSALVAGIMLAGPFVYLFQTHPFEEFALNLEVIAITLGKVTQKAGRSAIAQGVDQCPNTVIYKISFAPNFCHNDCPRFV